MSVYDNLAFGLRNKKMPESEIKAAIDRAAEMLGLHELLEAQAAPALRAASSSGWRSAAASCATRWSSCSTSRSATSTPSCAPRCASRSSACMRQLPTTSVFVTHDQVEAMTLGDRVVVMRDGRVQQAGTPLVGLRQPGQQVRRRLHRRAGDEFPRRRDRARRASTLVAQSPAVKLAVTEPSSRARSRRGRAKPVIMGVRPEHLALGDGVAEPQLRRRGRGGRAARLGDPAGDAGRRARASPWPASPRDARSPPATRSACRCQPGRLHFFDPQTEKGDCRLAG